MKAYIDPPGSMPFPLRFFTWLVERKIGKPMLVARILAWYPKAALGAGVMESLVARQEGAATVRLLKLVRLQVSFLASCPFCIDMNAAEYAGLGITQSEIKALQGLKDLDRSDSFSREERLALGYARALTQTPIAVDAGLLRDVLETFSQREMVVIVSTIAQVNFWTRLVQGIGVPPLGFSQACATLQLDDYATLDKERH